MTKYRKKKSLRLNVNIHEDKISVIDWEDDQPDKITLNYVLWSDPDCFERLWNLIGRFYQSHSEWQRNLDGGDDEIFDVIDHAVGHRVSG